MRGSSAQAKRQAPRSADAAPLKATACQPKADAGGSPGNRTPVKTRGVLGVEEFGD